MTKNYVEMIIKAKDEFSKTMDKFNTKLDDVKKSSNQSSTSISKFFKGLKSVGIITTAVASLTALAKGLKDVANAAAQQELSDVRLMSALKLITPRYKEAFTELSNYASALQRVSIYGDETIQQTMQLGLSMGISLDKIKEATSLTIEIADAFNLDLGTAMKYIAQLYEGHASSLARYIPELRNFGGTAEDTAMAVELLKNKLNGMSEAISETAVGRTKQLANAFGDLKETLGRGLSEALKGITAQLTEFFTNLNDKIKKKYTIKLTLENSGQSDISALEITIASLRKKLTQMYKNIFGEGRVPLQDKDYKKLLQTIKTLEAELEKKQQLQLKTQKNINKELDKTKDKTNDLTKTFKDIYQNALDYYNHMVKMDDKSLDELEERLNYWKKIKKQMEEAGAKGKDLWTVEEKIYEIEKQLKETFKSGIGGLGNLSLEDLKGYLGFKQNVENQGGYENQTYSMGISFNNLSIFQQIGVGFENLKSSFGGIIEKITAFGGAISSALGPIWQLIIQSKPVQYILQLISKTLLDALDKALKPLLGIIIPILNPVLQIFAKLIESLKTPLAVVGGLIRWLIDKLKALGTTIFYIVSFQWGKLGKVNWGGSVGSYVNEVLNYNPTGYDEFTGSYTGTSTGGANYTTSRTKTQITFAEGSIQINTDVLAGVGGFRELAKVLTDYITDNLQLNL